MLDSIRQITNDGMHMRTTRYFLHMQVSLRRIAMCQGKQTGSALASNLELVTSSGTASALIQFLEWNTFTFQILPDKNGGCLNVLSFMFYAKSIITISQRKEERSTSASQRIEYPQPPGQLLSVSPRENGDIEQHSCEHFVGLPFVATNLRHFHGNKRHKLRTQRTQKWPLYLANLLKILVNFASGSQSREDI